MSQENLVEIEKFYEAWNRRDLDRALQLLDDEAFELRIIGGLEDLVGAEFHGREGALRCSRDIIETIGSQVELDRTFDLGDRVVVTGTFGGAGGESGAPTRAEFGQIWSFRGGKVVRLDSYYGAEGALEAAGLSE